MSSQTAVLNKLPRAEWDFPTAKMRRPAKSPGKKVSQKSSERPGSKDEVEFCYQYEFTRTSGLPLDHPAFSTCDISKRFFELCTEYYPKTPWLEIPRKERWSVMHEMERFHLQHPTLFRSGTEVFGGADDQMKDVIGVGCEGVTHFTAIPFVISWHRSDGEIIESFKRWLKDNAPPANQACKIKSAGKDLLSQMGRALKRLGAYRLCAENDLTAAYDHALEILKSPLYVPKVWRMATAKARSMLQAWEDPIATFLDRTGCGPELCECLSEENRKKLGKAKLRKWLTDSLTPWGARRFLIYEDDVIKNRLILLCRYGDYTEPKRILASARKEKLPVGLDEHGLPLKTICTE